MSPREPLAFCAIALAIAVFMPARASSDEETRPTAGNVREAVSEAGSSAFENVDIQRLEREASAFANNGRPTHAQKVWFTKIRKLMEGAESEDGEAAVRVRRALRAIDDPDAIPALMQLLRTSDDEGARLLYVQILGDMPPAAAGAALAEEALFDESSLVRATAQEISKRQNPEFVRPYYAQALRFPNRAVVGRAVRVLASVDNQEVVPFLIDSLYSTYVNVETRRSCSMSRVYFLAAAAGTKDHPDNVISHRDRVISARADHVKGRYFVHKTENPQVKDVLEAMTNQSFGYDTAAWHRWWRSTQVTGNKTTSR
jgi:HEAT repeats